MELTDADKKLIEQAKALVGATKVTGGTVKEVGAALRTRQGTVYTGVSIDLFCGVGFCAEHSAIAQMISQSDETEIDTIVAFGTEIMYPCGRCRELMQLIDGRNREGLQVIISPTEKVALKDLLPGSWL